MGLRIRGKAQRCDFRQVDITKRQNMLACGSSRIGRVDNSITDIEEPHWFSLLVLANSHVLDRAVNIDRGAK